MSNHLFFLSTVRCSEPTETSPWSLTSTRYGTISLWFVHLRTLLGRPSPRFVVMNFVISVDLYLPGNQARNLSYYTLKPYPLSYATLMVINYFCLQYHAILCISNSKRMLSNSTIKFYQLHFDRGQLLSLWLRLWNNLRNQFVTFGGHR